MSHKEAEEVAINISKLQVYLNNILEASSCVTGNTMRFENCLHTKNRGSSFGRKRW
jgi:hypothetical protein